MQSLLQTKKLVAILVVGGFVLFLGILPAFAQTDAAVATMAPAQFRFAGTTVFHQKAYQRLGAFHIHRINDFLLFAPRVN